MNTLEDLLLLEHAGWRSLCEQTGSTFYGEIMTTDGVMVLAHGMILDRDAVVASLDQAPPWETYEISEERLIQLHEGAAVLIYRGTAHRGAGTSPADGTRPDPDGAVDFEALMASTYVRHQDRWRLACYQQTPVPG